MELFIFSSKCCYPPAEVTFLLEFPYRIAGRSNSSLPLFPALKNILVNHHFCLLQQNNPKLPTFIDVLMHLDHSFHLHAMTDLADQYRFLLTQQSHRQSCHLLPLDIQPNAFASKEFLSCSLVSFITKNYC